MKGDVGWDIACPLCPWVGHPRKVTYYTGNHIYVSTPDNVRKKALYQHLLNAHPSLSSRERSVILDRAIHMEEELPS